MLKHIPNALTLTRLVLAPVIAWLYWTGGDAAVHPPDADPGFDEAVAHMSAVMTTSFTLAAILFIVAALTDLFDGMAARAFNAQSKFGRIIDPIADKALVGLPLIAIVLPQWDATFSPGIQYLPLVTVAVIVIVLRDVTMTIVRLAAPDGEGARVSSLAKIKTALELVVVGAYILATAVHEYIWAPVVTAGDDAHIFLIHVEGILQLIWIALLAITAALSAYTGWQYLRPAKKS